MRNCKTCGRVTTEVNPCKCLSPAPLPPHAAGEEVTPESLAAQVYERGEAITVEQLHALHSSPAASQAAPEMQDLVDRLRDTGTQVNSGHDRYIDNLADDAADAITQLADRVVELERKNADLERGRSEIVEVHYLLLRENAALQASSAQETKRLDDFERSGLSITHIPAGMDGPAIWYADRQGNPVLGWGVAYNNIREAMDAALSQPVEED